jgi:hypothetical protein
MGSTKPAWSWQCPQNEGIAWAGKNTLRIWRLLPLGESRSQAQASGPYIGLDQITTYRGVITAVSITPSLAGKYINLVIPSKSVEYSFLYSDSQTYQEQWKPRHPIPFGSAFDCFDPRWTPIGSHNSMTIIDLRQTRWAVDTSVAKWYRTGTNNIGAPVDLSNPQLVVVNATGYCGVTTTFADYINNTDAWAGAAYIPVTPSNKLLIHSPCCTDDQ